MIAPSDIAWTLRVITRNQLAAQRDEHDERAAWLHRVNDDQIEFTVMGSVLVERCIIPGRSVTTYDSSIETIERVSDSISDGLKAAMPCDCRAMGSRVRCGSCGNE